LTGLIRRSACAAAALLALTGCAQVIAQSRIRSALQSAGLSQDHSECMAARMVDRLTIDQLRKLEGLGPRDGEPRRPAGLADFVERVRRVGDAEVIAVTASSAGLCATGLGRLDAATALS
jgi:hypothetical protein